MEKESGYGVMRVKASLLNVYDKDRVVFKRLGGVLGDTISREFLVPDDIQLWAIHYVLTTAFGFLNEHLHAFRLTDDDMKRLTGNKAEGWYYLVGKLFRTPVMYGHEEDPFWCDDYRSGSFRAWRRKKYTGPYVYRGTCDTYHFCRTTLEKKINLDEILYADMMKDPYGDEFCLRIGPDDPESDESVNIVKTTFRDMTCAMLLHKISLDFEADYNTLMESLTVKQIHDEYVSRIIWHYDFGDSWQVLLELSEEESPKIAVQKCLDTHRPVMLYADGLNLVEDAGSICGFSAFLLSLYGSPRDIARYEGDEKYLEYSDEFEDSGYHQYESREAALEWAWGLEWNEKNPSLNSWF